MPTPITSPQSDDSLGALTPRETSLSSQQLKTAWTEKIKDQALFSARTTSKSYLDALKKELVEIASRQVNPLVAETRLKNVLQNLGYRPEVGFPDSDRSVPGATPGSMRDLSSSRRIQLIIDTNEKQARSLGQIAASESPEALMSDPAWKLTRTGARKKPRGDWKRRWNEAGKACGWKGAAHTQMVALKTSPIWQKIAEGAGGYRDTVGAPYPPFAFGSGLAWVNYDWDDWEDLCKREGIPDGLDEIRNKARELKAAREGAVKPTVAPMSVDRPNERPQGADLSPLLGDTKAKQPVQITPSPDVGYKADLSVRDSSASAVTESATAISRAQRMVKAIASEISELRKTAESEYASFFGPKAAFPEQQFVKSAGECDKAYKQLETMAVRVNEYARRVSGTRVPDKEDGQKPYDRSMRLYASASKAVSAGASGAVGAARSAKVAADNEAARIRASFVRVKRGRCIKRLEEIRPEVDRFVTDKSRPWADRNSVASCFRIMSGIAETGNEERLNRYIEHISRTVPGIAGVAN